MSIFWRYSLWISSLGFCASGAILAAWYLLRLRTKLGNYFAMIMIVAALETLTRFIVVYLIYSRRISVFGGPFADIQIGIHLAFGAAIWALVLALLGFTRSRQHKEEDKV